jgi:hypothetical protein
MCRRNSVYELPKHVPLSQPRHSCPESPGYIGNFVVVFQLHIVSGSGQFHVLVSVTSCYIGLCIRKLQYQCQLLAVCLGIASDGFFIGGSSRTHVVQSCTDRDRPAVSTSRGDAETFNHVYIYLFAS